MNIFGASKKSKAEANVKSHSKMRDCGKARGKKRGQNSFVFCGLAGCVRFFVPLVNLCCALLNILAQYYYSSDNHIVFIFRMTGQSEASEMTEQTENQEDLPIVATVIEAS